MVYRANQILSVQYMGPLPYIISSRVQYKFGHSYGLTVTSVLSWIGTVRSLSGFVCHRASGWIRPSNLQRIISCKHSGLPEFISSPEVQPRRSNVRMRIRKV